MQLRKDAYSYICTLFVLKNMGKGKVNLFQFPKVTYPFVKYISGRDEGGTMDPTDNLGKLNCSG